MKRHDTNNVKPNEETKFSVYMHAKHKQTKFMLEQSRFNGISVPVLASTTLSELKISMIGCVTESYSSQWNAARNVCLGT